jgi:MFS family permease
VLEATQHQLVRAKWALRITFFFMGMAVAASSARLAEIKHNTGGSQSAFGAALMLGNIGGMFGNFIGGRLTHRLGTRTILRIAMFIFVCAQISYGFINQLWQVPLCAFAGGSSYALANIGANSQGSMIQQRAGKSLMPSFHGSWSIGALTASFAAGFAAKHLSTGTHILINSVIAFAGASLVYRYLLPTAVDTHDQNSNAGLPQNEPIPEPIKKFIFVLAIGSMMSVIAEASVGDWSTILLHEDFNVALGVNTYGYTSFILIQTIGRFTVGRLIDKYSIQTIMRLFAAIGGVGYFSGLVIANAIHTSSPHAALITMCIAYAILGLGLAPMAPSFASIAGAIPGIPTARAVARMQMISAFGFFFGRGLVSLLTKFIGLPLALLMPAIALIIAGQISYRLRPEKLAK